MEAIRQIGVRLRCRIRHWAGARRRIANAARGWSALTWAAAVGSVGLLLLSGWIPNAFVNAGLFGIGAVAGLAILVRLLRQLERRHSDLWEAAGMETLAGGLNSRLISALDFIDRDPQTELTRTVIEHAAEDLKIDFDGLLDRRGLRRHCKRGALMLAVFLLLGASPWFGFTRTAATWGEAWFAVHELLFPTRYTLTPEAGRHIHKIGEAVPVTIQFSREGYRTVTLVNQTSGKDVTRTVLDVGTDRTAGITLEGTSEAEHRIRFEFGRRGTDEIEVVFALPPVLENMQTELIYPAYTRLLPKDLEGLQDRLTGLVGTKITMGFTFSKEIAWATLTGDNGEKVPLDVVGRFASASLIHRRAGHSSLEVGDLHGFQLARPYRIDFEILEDERPRLFVPSFLKQNMPQLMDDLKTFGFGVRGQDDYGVSRFALKWSKATLENRDEVLEKGEIERLIDPARQKVTVEFQKTFASLAVKPGDLIHFQVVAYDNREPDPQQVSSVPFSMFIHQAGLSDMAALIDPMFGMAASLRGRIGKVRRDTTFAEPQELKTTEKVRNEFEADVTGLARVPVLRGDNGRLVQNYFQVLSTANYDETEP